MRSRREHVEAFVRRPAHSQQARHRFRTLKVSFRWVEEGETAESPMRNRRSCRNSRFPVLSDDEIKRLLKACDCKRGRSSRNEPCKQTSTVCIHTNCVTPSHRTGWHRGGNETDLMRLVWWRSRAMLQRFGASVADERVGEAHK